MAQKTHTQMDEQTDVYSDDAPLIYLFGDGAKVRIISAFLSDPDFDHTITDIAQMSGVSRNTVYRHLDDLRNLDIVIETRRSGGSSRYQINKEHPMFEKLEEVEDCLVHELVDEGCL